MKNNNKNIAILILSLLAVYVLVASYFVYDDYRYMVNKTIKTSDQYCLQKSGEISSYINNSVQTTNTIGCMLSSAREKYGYDLIPFVEQGLKNICVEKPTQTRLVAMNTLI